MVDTLVLEHIFQNVIVYNNCYSAIDAISERQDDKHMRLHRRYSKELKIKTYTTTAFKRFGWLEIMFYKYEKGCAVRIIFKPICLLYSFSQLRLSTYRDYEEIEKRFNTIIDAVNFEAGFKILPYLQEWRVTRIDYTVDLETPLVNLYVNLFKRGFIPKGFRIPGNYPTSCYLVSDSVTINFYDKLTQVKEKHDYTNEDIKKDIGALTDGILRLEVQCKPGFLFYLRRKHNVTDSTLKSLWNPYIAADAIKQKISAIVGQENFYDFESCIRVILSKSNQRGFKTYSQIFSWMKTENTLSLQDMKCFIFKKINKEKYFNVIISRIRALGINPIPVDCVNNGNLNYLENPYNLIDELIAKENASQE